MFEIAAHQQAFKAPVSLNFRVSIELYTHRHILIHEMNEIGYDWTYQQDQQIIDLSNAYHILFNSVSLFSKFRNNYASKIRCLYNSYNFILVSGNKL